MTILYLLTDENLWIMQNLCLIYLVWRHP